MQTTTTSQKVKIGLFAIVGIILLIAGIFLIGRQQNLFSDNYHIYGTFKNVGGLSVGNNVRFSGITAGTVEDISVINDSTVRVDMRVQEKYQRFIKSDAVASIGSDGLMGDKLITISPGTTSPTPLKDGQRIATTNPLDIDKAIAQITNVAQNASTITDALAGMLSDVRGGKGTIGRLMQNEQLAIGVEGTLANTQRITSSLADLSMRIKEGKGSLGQLVYTNQLSGDIHRVMNSADSALSTVQVAAYNFGENMKALQGNFLLRGYFKKKAKNEEEQQEQQTGNLEKAAQTQDDSDLSEAELEEIKRSAEKALEEKRKAKTTTTGQTR
jgi:phospholipid/cholesterol/gamma-HCH transport system substrate-binding protein